MTKKIISIMLVLICSYSIFSQEYTQSEIDTINNDIETIINKYLEKDIKYEWRHKIFKANQGAKVQTKADEIILDIAWFNNDDKISKKEFSDNSFRKTKGSGLGFFIITKSNDYYFIYAHLNDNATSTKELMEVFNKSKLAKAEFSLPPKVTIGEAGDTGYSLYTNLLSIIIEKID